MRWQFIDPDNQSDAEERRQIEELIDSWWQAFQAKTGDLHALFTQKAQWDLPEWMKQNLGAISSDLMWEYGAAVRGKGHRLVITPESDHHLRPLVRHIIAKAPAIAGWEFYEYRLAEDLENTKATVEGRTDSSIDDFLVRASIGDHRRINLIYASPTIPTDDDQAAFGAAFIATETLLGEQLLDRWIGAIEISPLDSRKDKRHFIPLDRLYETVQALIGGIHDQLPSAPHHEWSEADEWTLWELKPEEQDDYEGQFDLYIGKSCNPEQWTAAHSSDKFYSERFSRCGETFCYVKIDGAQGLSEDGLEDKSEIEDALDAALKPDGLGCHVGGGTGLRYSYVDLALTDVEKAIPRICECLREGKLPLRTWIQFYDTDLAAEWVGIYPDTPAPPMSFE